MNQENYKYAYLYSNKINKGRSKEGHENLIHAVIESIDRDINNLNMEASHSTCEERAHKARRTIKKNKLIKYQDELDFLLLKAYRTPDEKLKVSALKNRMEILKDEIHKDVRHYDRNLGKTRTREAKIRELKKVLNQKDNFFFHAFSYCFGYNAEKVRLALKSKLVKKIGEDF